MAAQPQFTSTPQIGAATLATPNPNRDGSGSLTTLLTAATNGSRVDRVTIKATGPTTAGMIRLFVHNGQGGFLVTEVPVPAMTPSGALPSFEQVIDFNTGDTSQFGLVLPPGHSLRAATQNGEAFHLVAFGGAF